GVYNTACLHCDLRDDLLVLEVQAQKVRGDLVLFGSPFVHHRRRTEGKSKKIGAGCFLTYEQHLTAPRLTAVTRRGRELMHQLRLCKTNRPASMSDLYAIGVHRGSFSHSQKLKSAAGFWIRGEARRATDGKQFKRLTGKNEPRINLG